MFLNDELRAGAAEQSAASFQIPTVEIATANDGRAAFAHCGVERLQTLLGGAPIFFAPDRHVLRARKNHPVRAPFAPWREALLEAASQSRHRLNEMQQRRSSDEPPARPALTQRTVEKATPTTEQCGRRRR